MGVLLLGPCIALKAEWTALDTKRRHLLGGERHSALWLVEEEFLTGQCIVERTARRHTDVVGEWYVFEPLINQHGQLSWPDHAVAVISQRTTVGGT